MPRLTVTDGERRQIVSFASGPSLRDVLDGAGIRIRSGCRGSGACGLCRVQIEEGVVSGPTKNEYLSLTGEELDGGIRLACQVVPGDDLWIRIVNRASQSNWRRLYPDEMPPGTPLAALGRSAGMCGVSYGVAVDLGTTNISLSLWDLLRPRRLSGRLGPNQQLHYGSDVVTRLVSACESRETAAELSRLGRDSIGEALLDICSREGHDLGRIRQIAVVGNTAMLALLANDGFEHLLRPEYWTREIDCRPTETETWFEADNINRDVVVEIIKPLAGFVGSDLLAGVLSTGLTEGAAGSLLIDFGTNSEIALWDGDTLWVTSAAGGPAFEGSGIRSGMGAEPGAIYRIDEEPGSPRLTVHVIGDGEAKGICGSGLTDLVAHMKRTGKLNSRGRFTGIEPGTSVAVAADLPHIRVDTRDIDLYQRAKAAIGAGVKAVLGRARMRAADLSRVCVCGTFGRYLNLENAAEIGLIPAVPRERIRLYATAALTGCELLLLSPERNAYLETVREKARLINLSAEPRFDELFMENLYLQPMRRFLKP